MKPANNPGRKNRGALHARGFRERESVLRPRSHLSSSSEGTASRFELLDNDNIIDMDSGRMSMSVTIL